MRVASRLTSGWIWCLMVWWNMDQLELLLQHNHNLGMIIITTILNTANHIPHWIMVVYVECREWYTGTCCHWISWVNPVPLMCLESLIKVWRSVCSLTYLIYLIIAFFETFGHCSDTRIIVYSLISRTMYHPSTHWHPQNHANIVTTIQVDKIYQLKTIGHFCWNCWKLLEIGREKIHHWSPSINSPATPMIGFIILSQE